MSQKPNILVVVTDQQHAKMMSCAGNSWVNTPTMDSLAATGTRFERCYATNPVCSPSRFSLWNSYMPSEIGMTQNGDPDQSTDISRFEQAGIGWRLREAGYDVAFGGKNHMPLGIKPENLGFDYIDRDERDDLARSSAAYIRKHAGSERPFCLVANLINPHDICYMAIRDFADRPEAGLSRRLMENAQGKAELRELDRALALPDGVSETEFFDSICPPLPENFEIQEDEPEAIRDLVNERSFRRYARNEWDDKRWRMHRWAYKNLTEKVDAELGVILGALRATGQEEDTVVIFTSDHGDNDASHRLEHKTVFYEESAGVPLIVSQKGTTPAGRVDGTGLISNGLDLLPTLCDYAGIGKTPGLEGLSFRDLAEGRPAAEPREAIRVENQIGQMIVWGRYKYARHFHGARAEQLWDLEKDPGETRNHAHDADQAEALATCRGIFDQLFPSATA